MVSDCANSPALPRLQKFLAEAGVASRRAAENLITAGRVSINGAVVRTLGVKVNPATDQVRVDGRVIQFAEPKLHLVIYKPAGVVCSSRDPHGRQRVLDLLPPSMPRLYSVGRLDYQSEGLLLLTNDGNFSLRLTHPRYKIPKVYRVVVDGRLGATALAQLRRGIVSEGELLYAEEVVVERADAQHTELRIVLRQGKNRQIRRMLGGVGHPVRRLVRTAIGGLQLNNLEPGQWRKLSHEEIRSLLPN